MAKNKNKGKKPAQNNKPEEKKPEVKVEEKAAEEISEEASDDIAEETEEAAEEAVEKAVEETAEISEESSEENEESEEETEDEFEDEYEDDEADNEKKETVPDIRRGAVDEKDARANEKFRKLTFIEKCKKDPYIRVCLILAFLAIVVAAIYFMLPNAMTPNMGITLQEFQTRYNNGEVNKSLINSGADIGFRTPPYVNIKEEPSILGEKEVVSAGSAYVDYFKGPLKYYSIGGIEGATRKRDGNLAYIRVFIQYDDSAFNTIWLYASNTISALYPDLSMYQAMDIAMKAMNSFDGDARYYVKGDFAFRLVAVKKSVDGGGELVYIVVDVAPRSAIGANQIREDLDLSASGTGATEASSETTVASSAATT